VLVSDAWHQDNGDLDYLELVSSPIQVGWKYLPILRKRYSVHCLVDLLAGNSTRMRPDPEDQSDFSDSPDRELEDDSRIVGIGQRRTQTWLDPAQLVEAFVEQTYSSEHYKALAKRAKSLIERKLEETNNVVDANQEEVQAKLTYRAKTTQSLREKLRVRNQTRNYQNASEILEDVKDLAGVRIMLYTPNKAQRRRVKEIIMSIWDDVEEIPHGDRAATTVPVDEDSDDERSPTKDEPKYVAKHLGYQAYHYRARMLKAHGNASYEWKSYDRVEIQVVSALGHAWAEAGHDVMYKTHAYGQPTTTEYRILDALNGLITSGDLLLEQFQESVQKRTYRKWTYKAQLEMFLKESDVLKKMVKKDTNIDSTSLQDHFAPGSMDVLFRFLEHTSNHFPLAVRNALMKLGYPDDPTSKLEAERSKFGSAFEPKDGYFAPLCLITYFIPGDELDLKGYSDLEKCSLMMDALILLQLFAESPKKAKAFLRENDMTEPEQDSLDFVLQSPHREDCQTGGQDGFEVVISRELQPAWGWFGKQVKEGRLCGIFFRLAVMGVPAKPLDYLQRIKELKIKSLSRSNTTEDSE
jgi:ppGpp synthetase/RelA/SpoT-type nucleotidyltranferase